MCKPKRRLTEDISKMNYPLVVCFLLWGLSSKNVQALEYDEGYEDYYGDYPQTDYQEDMEEPRDKPDFVTKGGTYNVTVGKELQLPCQVNDLGKNQMIWTKAPGVKGAEDQLYIGNFNISPSPRRHLQDIDNNQGTILTLMKVKVEDAGTYSCKIADNSYNQTLTFVVNVKRVGEAGAGRQPTNANSGREGGAGNLMLLISVAIFYSAAASVYSKWLCKVC